MPLGKEAAVYLPSGTMCNQIAARVHCRQGDEIILAASAHRSMPNPADRRRSRAS